MLKRGLQNDCKIPVLHINMLNKNIHKASACAHAAMRRSCLKMRRCIKPQHGAPAAANSDAEK